MASFFREWGQLLVAPFPAVGGWSALFRFMGSASVAGVLSAAVGVLGSIPWWTLPLVAFVAFYLSLTAGMAWERALVPQVKVGPLALDENKWGNSIGIFYILIKSGLLPVKIRVLITGVESLGRGHIERPWEGHWRGLGAFDGRLDAGSRSQYGLIGVSSHSASGNPCLFIFSQESEATGRYQPVSHDAPLEQQGETRVDIVVNCETADGQRGKTQERTFYIALDRNSPVGYRVAATGSPDDKRKRCVRRTYRRFLRLIDHVVRTAERIRRNCKNHPGRTIGKMKGGSS